MTNQISGSDNMTPVQEAFMAFQVYLLAIYVHIGFKKEILPMDVLGRIMKFEGYDIPSPWKPRGELMKEDIFIVAENLYRLAFANLFITLGSALEDVFGKITNSTMSDLDFARIIVFQLRNAYSHYPPNPVWRIGNPTHQIRCRVGEINYEVDLTKLNGQEVLMDHYNGWMGAIKLYKYCFEKLRDKTGDYSRTLDFSL